jgi:hypothetical protein
MKDEIALLYAFTQAFADLAEKTEGVELRHDHENMLHETILWEIDPTTGS